MKIRREEEEEVSNDDIRPAIIHPDTDYETKFLRFFEAREPLPRVLSELQTSSSFTCARGMKYKTKTR